MKYLNCRPLLFCIAIILPLPLSAQPYAKQCPAPLVGGKWSVDQIAGTVANVFSGQGHLAIPVPPPNETDFANITTNGCTDSSFTLKVIGRNLVFPMKLQKWADGNGVVYTGSTSSGTGLTESIEMTLGNPHQALGDALITMKYYGGTGVVPFQLFFQSLEPVNKRTRYECRCKGLLKKWIDEEIAQSKKFQNTYGNSKYQKRPKGVPLNASFNEWEKVYDDIIALIATENVTYSKAVKTVVNAYYPKGKKPANGTSASVKNILKNSITAAETDPDTCEVKYTTIHRQECFPALANKTTVIHENVHVKACDDRRIKGVTGVPKYNVTVVGKEEALAYATEIKFLQSFIKGNCN
jgi:hypothetical protein